MSEEDGEEERKVSVRSTLDLHIDSQSKSNIQENDNNIDEFQVNQTLGKSDSFSELVLSTDMLLQDED